MGTGLDPATTAAEDWALLNGSSYKSSGINSGVAGFRCRGLIWDDLTKNRKEADSAGIRTDVYNAYIDDARSRKTPDAWEVGIGTRWHEDEIMGRILPEGYAGESGYMECRDGNVWLVVCIPAECERADDPLGRERGEMLWPEWFGEGYWAEKRVNPRSWASLYQQRPAPEEGIYFKEDWFRFYDSLPEGDHYIAFDPAVTGEEDDADADDTCIAPFVVDQYARIYLVDEWVQKATMDVWVEKLIRWGIVYKPLEIISESGVIRRASEPWIKRAMRTLKAFFTFSWVHRHADKTAMARAAQGMVSSGQFYLPNNSIGQQWKDEMLRFPAGKEDHRVDTLANLCLRLEALWEANAPDIPNEEKPAILGGELKVKDFMPARFPKKRSRWSRSRTQ
jgi:phage terminase large subunit-like protein